MNVIFTVLRLFPSARQHTQVIEILKMAQNLTRPALGCLGCWLSEEDVTRPHISYAEQWESEQALQTHIRSDLYWRVLAAMELSKLPPEVSFYFVTEKKGFGLIEAL